MTRTVPPHPPVPHPTVRENPFDPPPELAAYRTGGGLRRMRYPDGHTGWLVTSHALARTVLADQRFSASSETKRAPVSRPGIAPFFGAPALPGWLVDMDPPQHTRIRRLLTGRFTVRRMKDLQPRVERLVEDHLDALGRSGPPADLVASFALPVPSLVICELLGVPYGERASFQRDSATLFRLDASSAEASAAMDRLDGLLRDLTEYRRGHPADDLLSQLVRDGTLTTEEIAGLGVLLLTAGHETTAGSLSLSTFALLSHPGQLDRFRADPSLSDGAVEELLRYLTIFHFGVPRTPLEDVELAGQVLRKGESVTVSLPAANRDPAQFDRPDELDVGRRAQGHMAFGFGIHQCVGQNLARMELRVALPALFQRFPTLALAVPRDEVPLSGDMGFYGVHHLPVTW
ncbi:cytochrome P450 [Streptomyces luomodiensis]|uniref:Cytochrome P450 n=1 Tax=Streptomyces luomodiensis TaxID=3026192 RepID=A0ABY9V9V9_9ACTN|nr:cytochrome P450 [Streptomyces sp. SCA4-21]WNF01033.1 cytochrome P450 [Streptomyces sp. SCA4-21]